MFFLFFAFKHSFDQLLIWKCLEQLYSFRRCSFQAAVCYLQTLSLPIADGWMKRGGGSHPLPGSGFSPPPPFICHNPATLPHPVPSLTLLLPLLARSHHYVLHITSPALQIGVAQEWQRVRERATVTGPLPSVATPGSNNRILSENRR